MELSEEQIDVVFGNRNALIDEDYRWPNAIVSYELSKNHSAGQNERILKAMKTIESVSCVKFRPRTNETDYVQFKVYVHEIFFLFLVY